jgi:transcriptional regulator with XRE-family HTH domain
VKAIPKPTLATRLRHLRESRGLTQRALSAKSGVSQGGILHIERGRVTRPSYDVVAKLAAALGVGVEELG